MRGFGTSAAVPCLGLALLGATLPASPRAAADDAVEPGEGTTSDDGAPPAHVAPPDSVIARMAENPLAGIVRVPLVNQTLFNLGPNDRTTNVLTLAPIVPIRLPRGYSVLTRAVFSIPTIPDVASETGSTTGFGDLQLELFLSKLFRGADGSMFSVAVGPAASLPTATDDALGSGKWQLGPSVGGSVEVGRFIGVLLVRNLWSVAGDEERPDTNRLFLETFLFVNLPKLWYLVSEPLIVANWENSDGNRWTVPVGGGAGRHFFFPGLPNFAFTTRLQAFYNVVRPDDLSRGEIAPEWALRINFVFWKPNPAVFDW